MITGSQGFCPKFKIAVLATFVKIQPDTGILSYLQPDPNLGCSSPLGDKLARLVGKVLGNPLVSYIPLAKAADLTALLRGIRQVSIFV